MSKTIVCKGCGAEIYKGAKKCPQCGKRNKKPIGLIIIGIIVLIIIISSVSSSLKDEKSKKTKYTWPSTGIATLLPQPEAKYGKINSESKDYFSMDVYDVSASDFNEYIATCKKEGFIVDYTGTSSVYYADDAKGNSLSLFYNEDKEELSIIISAYIEEVEEDSAIDNTKSEMEEDSVIDSANSEAEEDSVIDDVNSETEQNTQETTETENDIEFRAWVDSYEEFMNEYVDFMKKYNESDGTDMSLLMDYNTIFTEYNEFMVATANISEEELSAEDYKYYLDAEARILVRLSEIQ